MAGAVQFSRSSGSDGCMVGYRDGPGAGEWRSPGICRHQAPSEVSRDSNPMSSSKWRTYLQWLGTVGPAFVPHPIIRSAQRVTLRSCLNLLNFKANHRKVIVTENGCMLFSANPHDTMRAASTRISPSAFRDPSAGTSSSLSERWQRFFGSRRPNTRDE